MLADPGELEGFNGSTLLDGAPLEFPRIFVSFNKMLLRINTIWRGEWRFERPSEADIFQNIGSANGRCSSKAKMSALSKVEMSVSAPFWEFGGCHFDGHGGDEQARAESS
jgi:hypothetical protein